MLERAERPDMVPLWCGLWLVAADASVLMPALRACHRTASADQRLFALTGTELTLPAAVSNASQSECAC